MRDQIKEVVPESPIAAITVKQEHIDMALPKNSGHCMISDAVSDSFFAKHGHRPKNVQTDLQTIRFTDGDARFVFLTPPTVQAALLAFDKGLKPEPFGFRINKNSVQVIPKKPIYKSEAKRKSEADAKKSPKKTRNKARLVARHVKGNHTEVVKIGGKTPPIGVLSGNRRNFGLRIAGSWEQTVAT